MILEKGKVVFQRLLSAKPPHAPCLPGKENEIKKKKKERSAFQNGHLLAWPQMILLRDFKKHKRDMSFDFRSMCLLSIFMQTKLNDQRKLPPLVTSCQRGQFAIASSNLCQVIQASQVACNVRWVLMQHDEGCTIDDSIPP